MSEPCPTHERLREHLDGSLPADVQASLTAHLDHCADCQRTLETLAGGSDSLLALARSAGDKTAESTPALEQVLGQWQTSPAETQAETGADKDDLLAFLAPSEKPGHLGRLGHYDILEVIGKGGFGIVLKAFDEKLHRIVAIKVLSPAFAANGSARKRFIREARTAAPIKNEHVVAIYDVEGEAQPPYLAMEMIDGISLQDKIDREGPLGVKEILRIGVQMAEGLAAAHKQGLVHRDIKPANILLENGVERVKITDFGLARAVDDASVTQSGTVAGTPLYMSPEQAEGLTIDSRSDLFSLGTVLYTMCTGHSPFRASGTHAVLKRVIDASPRPIREINNEVPDWLCDIIAKLHAKKPEDRFQTANEVAELLGQRLADVQAGRAGSVSDRSATPVAVTSTPVADAPGLRKHPWPVAVTLVALAALAVIAFIAGTRQDPGGKIHEPKMATLVLGGLYDPMGLEKVVLRSVEIVDEKVRPDGKHSAELKQEPSFLKQKKTSQVMLPPGKYEVEVVCRPGYVLGKYEITRQPPGVDISGMRAGDPLGLGGRIGWLIEVKPGDQLVIQVAVEKETTAPADQQRLQGRWVPVAGAVDGKAMTPAMLADFSIVDFQGTSFLFHEGKQPVAATFKLAPQKNPKEIDIIYPWDDKKVIPGIYRFQGETLDLCLGSALMPRPKDFATAPGSSFAWITLKRKVEKSKTLETAWVQLFNGKDLDGWKKHPTEPGNWGVEGGLLVGKSGRLGYLFSERGDYANFHLRAKVKLNAGGDSGIFVRSKLGPMVKGKAKYPGKKSPPGYEAQICHDASSLRTGSLFVVQEGAEPPLIREDRQLVQPDQWFTLEVIAKGPWLTVKVNGERTADVKNETYTRGHIALQMWHAKTVVHFEKIEIKELPATAADKKEPPKPAK